MNNYVVLYNPYSKNNHGEEEARKLDKIMANCNLTYVFMPAVKDYKEFFKEHTDDIILCGGDGTLNIFINETKNIPYKNNIWYFAAGSGNDFKGDVKPNDDKPFLINDYIKNLPTVTVNGKTYNFLNGVGYGIDGYCCEVGDEEKKNSTKPVNYAAVAIKGLLFKFKNKKAKITVDDKVYIYDNVWLAPTMNGRYYGGGMMIAPNQNRLSDSHDLSVVVFHCKSKLRTLMIFPSIFKGEHIEYKKVTSVITGKDIKVEFNEPCALQIDGETILNVTEYEAHAYRENKK